jgi:hypothetical protein
MDELQQFDGPCAFRKWDPKDGSTTMLGFERFGPHD